MSEGVRCEVNLKYHSYHCCNVIIVGENWLIRVTVNETKWKDRSSGCGAMLKRSNSVTYYQGWNAYGEEKGWVDDLYHE